MADAQISRLAPERLTPEIATDELKLAISGFGGSCDLSEPVAKQREAWELVLTKIDALILAVQHQQQDEIARLTQERDSATKTMRQHWIENGRLSKERDEAMRVLDPNMPESGLVDACRQVKQVAISEADNADKAEQRAAALDARLQAIADRFRSLLTQEPT